MTSAVSGSDPADPSPIFESPIKPKTRQIRAGVSPKIAKRLFAEDQSPPKATSKENSPLSLYPHPLVAQSLSVSEEAMLRDLVTGVEDTLIARTEGDQRNTVRSRVILILKSNIPVSEKVEQLGMILFYLDRDGELPVPTCLMAYRANEIMGEVQSYLSLRTHVTTNPLIPSGKTHYLMRAFAHMVISSRQIFNPGALYAIRALLERPDLAIAAYFQPEHREHILVVVDQMIHNPAFVSLFRKPCAAHPDLEDLLRFDLKLPPGASLHSVHILYACLMAFFSDIRQNDNPNCYAISALIYAIENCTYKAFATLVGWIETGTFQPDAQTKIPLRPYLERRIAQQDDLKIPLEQPAALQIAPLEQIFSLLSLETPADRKRKAPLQEVLPSSAAKTLFHAYKSNLLIQLMLKALEFSNENVSDKDSNHPVRAFSHKALIVRRCVGKLEWLCLGKGVPSTLFEKLSDRLNECLWLEAQCEPEVIQELGYIVVNGRKIVCKGSERELAHLFGRCVRIFYLGEHHYRLLDTITDLQQILIDEVQRLPVSEVAQSDLLKAIRSQGFRMALAKELAEDIGNRAIDNNLLDWADLLILNQRGGYSDTVLKHVFDIPLHRQRLPESKTPYTFLRNLSEFISHSVDLSHLRTTPKIIIQNLLDQGSHIWTLSPSCWKFLTRQEFSFEQFMQRSVFDPAKRRLASTVSSQQVDQLITRYNPHPATQERMRAFFRSKPRLTFAEFRRELLYRTQSQELRTMEAVIQSEFGKVTLSLMDFQRILTALNLTLPTPLIERIFQELHLGDSFSPHELAERISMTLMDANTAILDPFDVEMAIASVCDLPKPFHLGDMNWPDTYGEDPFHIKFVVQYNWILDVPSYYVRNHGETREPIRDYAQFEISFSPTLLKNPRPI